MDGQVSFSIGDAAKAAGLTVKAIRYYEDIELVPKPARTGGVHTRGHRVYSESDLGRLSFIRHARLLGLSLADIRELVALADGKGCPSDQPEYRDMLTRHLREIDERVQHLLGLRTAIESLMAPARPPKGQRCSWGTCACMGGQAGPPPPDLSTTASNSRRKGRNHV